MKPLGNWKLICSTDDCTTGILVDISNQTPAPSKNPVGFIEKVQTGHKTSDDANHSDLLNGMYFSVSTASTFFSFPMGSIKLEQFTNLFHTWELINCIRLVQNFIAVCLPSDLITSLIWSVALRFFIIIIIINHHLFWKHQLSFTLN